MPNEDSLEKLYFQVEQATQNIVNFNEENNYQEAGDLINQRLELLKSLATKVKGFALSSVEGQRYVNFLQKLQKIDDEQLVLIEKERLNALNSVSKQSNIKTAVNAYQQVKKC